MPRRAQIAATWWSQRWLDALEQMGWPARLARGRTYARGGRVHDVVVEPGHIAARVQGTRPQPYRVDVRLPTLADDVWARALALLGREAAPEAALLAGELPPEVDETFVLAGHSLFPAADERVALGCSCPDTERPCKHVAALFYVIAADLEREPFLLFTLRGQTRDEVVATLRTARAAAWEPTDATPIGSPPQPLATELVEMLDRYWHMDLIAVEAAPGRVDLSDTSALRRLVQPPRALGGTELSRELAEAYRVVADRASRLTTGR